MIARVTCPSCGYPNPAGVAACESCDTPLAASEPPPRRVIVGVAPRALPEAGEPDEPEEEPLRVGGLAIQRGLGYLAFGFGAALVVMFACCGFGRIFSEGAGLLFHESGHTFAGWFFGYPSIPSARGVTLHYPRQPLIAVAVWALLAYGVWRFRTTRPVAAALAAIALLYPFLAVSSLHRHLMSFAGHGTEVVFAVVFMWRALTGGFAQELERPIYATLAWLLVISNLMLWAGVAFDINAIRAIYESIAIAGDNDMVRIADGLGWQVGTVGFLVLLYTIALPTATLTLWWFVWRRPAERRRLVEWLTFKRDLE